MRRRLYVVVLRDRRRLVNLSLVYPRSLLSFNHFYNISVGRLAEILYTGDTHGFRGFSVSLFPVHCVLLVLFSRLLIVVEKTGRIFVLFSFSRCYCLLFVLSLNLEYAGSLIRVHWVVGSHYIDRRSQFRESQRKVTFRERLIAAG